MSRRDPQRRRARWARRHPVDRRARRAADALLLGALACLLVVLAGCLS